MSNKNTKNDTKSVLFKNSTWIDIDTPKATMNPKSSISQYIILQGKLNWILHPQLSHGRLRKKDCGILNE